MLGNLADRTIHCKPFIQILTLGQPDSLAKTAASESSLGKLPQLVAIRALGGGAGLERGACARIAGGSQSKSALFESAHSR